MRRPHSAVQLGKSRIDLDGGIQRPRWRFPRHVPAQQMLDLPERDTGCGPDCGGAAMAHLAEELRRKSWPLRITISPVQVTTSQTARPAGQDQGAHHPDPVPQANREVRDTGTHQLRRQAGVGDELVGQYDQCRDRGPFARHADPVA